MNHLTAALLIGALAAASACTKAPTSDVKPAGDAVAAEAPVAGAGTPSSAPELPVRIGEMTPPPVTATRAGATPLNAASVYDAVANGMGPAAADIDVSVQGGIVVLKGSVKTQADFQAAHYISRALEGVDEVDASGLKVQ